MILTVRSSYHRRSPRYLCLPAHVAVMYTMHAVLVAFVSRKGHQSWCFTTQQSCHRGHSACIWCSL